MYGLSLVIQVLMCRDDFIAVPEDFECHKFLSVKPLGIEAEPCLYSTFRLFGLERHCCSHVLSACLERSAGRLVHEGAFGRVGLTGGHSLIGDDVFQLHVGIGRYEVCPVFRVDERGGDLDVRLDGNSLALIVPVLMLCDDPAAAGQLFESNECLSAEACRIQRECDVHGAFCLVRLERCRSCHVLAVILERLSGRFVHKGSGDCIGLARDNVLIGDCICQLHVSVCRDDMRSVRFVDERSAGLREVDGLLPVFGIPVLCAFYVLIVLVRVIGFKLFLDDEGMTLYLLLTAGEFEHDVYRSVLFAAGVELRGRFDFVPVLIFERFLCLFVHERAVHGIVGVLFKVPVRDRIDDTEGALACKCHMATGLCING